MSRPSNILSEGSARSVCKIFMVGFTTTLANSTLNTVVDMVGHLVPEASVVPYELLDPSENVNVEPGGPGTSTALSSDWIFTEATSLLEKIEETVSQGEEIILSGYGLGGIVTKQAVMIAHMNPTFYKLSPQISSLIFFDVPHESASHQPWEGLLINLIKTTPSVKLQNTLYSTVTRLARLVSDLSMSFSKVEPKYRIVNLVPHHAHERAAQMESSTEEPSSWLNSLQRAVPWPGPDEVGSCEVDDIPSLRILRTCFTPTWNTRSINLSPTSHGKEYSDALRTLSPWTCVINENMVPGTVHVMKTLEAVYDLELREYSFGAVRGGIVNVIAPDEEGSSALLKLLSQHLQAQASLVVVDNFLGFSNHKERPITFYNLLVSTLYQILSQKPSLLTPPVQVLIGELLQRKAWAEGAIQNLLSVLFASCDTDFLVVVHNYGSRNWPDAARKWWSSLIDELNETDRPGASTCTLIASGMGLEYKHRPSGRDCHKLDFTRDYEQKKGDFLRKECARILTEIGSEGSGFLRGSRGRDIQNEIVTRVLSLPGSFGELSYYLDQGLRGLTFSTPSAIFRSIGTIPKTVHEFYHRKLLAILHSTDGELLSWTTSVLSWVLKSTRPLQTQELAVAVAIDPSGGQRAKMNEAISLDMETDIHRNLAGLVIVEDGFVRIASPTAREILRDPQEVAFSKYHLQTDVSDTSALKIWGDAKLVVLCLRYLSMVLGQQLPQGAVGTAFVDYAVRCWPAHFMRIANPDESLCAEVAEFLGNFPTANRWFRLYTASKDEWQLLSFLRDPERQHLRDETEDVLGLTPAEISSQAGLWTMVTYSLTKNEGIHWDIVSHQPTEQESYCQNGSSLRKMLVRRGGLEGDAIFFDRNISKLYLECAIASDDVQVVKSLVDGLDENTIGTYRLLHLAAFMGSPKMVQMLLGKRSVQESGKTIDENDRTAFHMAALSGRRELLELLERGLVEGNTDNLYQKDKNGDTALLLATRAGNVAAAKFIIGLSDIQGLWEHDVDTRIRSTAHCAIESCPQLLEYLLAGSPIHEVTKGNEDGLTLLHLAALSGSVVAVKTILGAALAMVKRSGETESSLSSGPRRSFGQLVVELVENLSKSTSRTDPAKITADEPSRFIFPPTIPNWGGHSTLLLYPMVCEVPMLMGCETAEIREKSLLDVLSSFNQVLLPNRKVSSHSRPHSHSRSFTQTVTVFHSRLANTFSRMNPSTLGMVMLVTDHQGRLPVHYAAENGQREVLQLMIREMNGSLEGWGDLMRTHRDSDGSSPGDLAAGRGHIDILEALYPDNTSIDCSVLEAATGAGQLLVVEYLLQHGVHPDGKPESGRTPLGLASAAGFYQVVRSLLRHGADINLPSHGRKTPLYLAVNHRRHEVAEILLDTPPSHTPVSDGTKGGAPTTAVVIDIPDSSRLTPLHVAASAGDDRLVKLLLRRGANVESRSSQRYTPLHLAVKGGMYDTAHLLVFEYGASLTSLAQDDKHPVWLAVESKDARMVQGLLTCTCKDFERGHISDSRYPIEFQRRDLITAVRGAALEIVEFLCTRYPRAAQPPEGTNGPLDSLLHIAARDSNEAMVKKLLGFELSPNLAGAQGRTPLHVAAASGNVEATTALLTAKAEPSITDSEGRTPLILACLAEKDAPKTCDALIDGGAAVDDTGDQLGRTPLFTAAYCGKVDVVQVLIRDGADVNWRDRYSWSILHAAAGKSDICQTLITAGADINYQKADGLAALHLACAWDSPEAVTCLLKNGAKANLPANNGDTPLHTAVRNGAHRVLDVMLSHRRAGPHGGIATPQNDEDELVDVRARIADGLTCLDLATSNEVLESLLKAADWDYQDLVRPYWGLIDEDKIDRLKPLIKADGRLLDANRLNEHDGTENILERAQVVLRLLHLAIDCREKDLWDTLVKLEAISKVPGGTHDDDGWTLNHYIHQAQPETDFIQDLYTVPFQGSTQSPSAIVFPKAWTGNSCDEFRMKQIEIKETGPEIEQIHIRENGLLVQFMERKRGVCLRSDHPFSPREAGASPYRYFEIDIRTSGTERGAVIAIGFCSEFSDMTDAQPGWEKWSVGYHGDDGGLFVESTSHTKRYKKFGRGNTVGCGIDYAKGLYFFTKNGDVIQAAVEKKSSLIYRKIYPCVGHANSKARVRVGFGPGEFAWTAAGLDEEVGGNAY